jgi:hypothetical protein
VRGRRAVRDVVDEAADQPRADEPGHRGERVQQDHDGEGLAVAAEQAARVDAQLRPDGDGQPLVHRSSPRVTVSR